MPPYDYGSGKCVVQIMDMEALKRKFKDNGGIMHTAGFTALKIDYRGIQKLIASGKIEKTRNNKPFIFANPLKDDKGVPMIHLRNLSRNINLLYHMMRRVSPTSLQKLWTISLETCFYMIQQ